METFHLVPSNWHHTPIKQELRKVIRSHVHESLTKEPNRKIKVFIYTEKDGVDQKNDVKN